MSPQFPLLQRVGETRKRAWREHLQGEPCGDFDQPVFCPVLAMLSRPAVGREQSALRAVLTVAVLQA